MNDRRDGLSPIQKYVAGGGDMGSASGRLQSLLMSAEASYQRRGEDGPSIRERTQVTRPAGVDPIAETLRHYKRDIAAERERRAREQALRESDGRRDALAMTEFTERYCRRATPAEYATWLIGHIRAGGVVTNPYDHEMPIWYTLASRPASVPTLYGVNSLSVIVPVGVDFTPGDIPATFHGACGHSHFYFVEGFRALPPDFIPLYSDVAGLLSP